MPGHCQEQAHREQELLIATGADPAVLPDWKWPNGRWRDGGKHSGEVSRLTLPSMGTTDGSLIEGEMARFSATAASARRPRALSGGVEDSLGRLVRPVSEEAPDREAEASLLRSEGSPGAGFSRVDAVFDSLA